MNRTQNAHSEDAGEEAIDTTYDDVQYYRLYEWLGKYYPESDLVYRSSQAMHRFRIVLEELRPFAREGRRLLDAGCGTGLYAIEYCKMGGRVHGVDISEDHIKRARARTKGRFSGASFDVLDLQKEVDWDERFDTVLFTEVLEHLNHPDVAIRNLANVLEANGYMIVTTPTPLHHSKRISWSYLREVLDGRKVLELHKYQTKGWAPEEYGAPNFVYRHSGFYPKGSKKWIESFGFKCLYYYTISSHIPGIRKATKAIPLPVLRALYPLNLFGCYNLQLFIRTP
ncbi:MAG: methyltransferase domain-containing protein [Thermoplasmata archaeon]